MKRVIITNNPKVKESLEGKAEIDFREETALQILKSGKTLAENGGKLLINPTRMSSKTYYRSLLFLMGDTGPHEKSLQLIEQCITSIGSDEKMFTKKPMLSHISQSKDLDVIQKVIG